MGIQVLIEDLNRRDFSGFTQLACPPRCARLRLRDANRNVERSVREDLRKTSMLRWSLAIALAFALPVKACWEDAAQRYQVNSALLYAIARTESGLDPRAIGANRNGSRDI